MSVQKVKIVGSYNNLQASLVRSTLASAMSAMRQGDPDKLQSYKLDFEDECAEMIRIFDEAYASIA